MSTSLKKRIVALAAVLAITVQAAGPAVFAADNAQNAAEASTLTIADIAAKPTVSKKTGLKVGQSVQGFTVKEIRDYKPLQAEMILLEHEKTGAKFMYIANDDTERSFSLSFHTIAEDETGKPHVFEHATLNGSDKYPANVTFQVMFQTYTTFVNAMTMPTGTVYPISSLSEKQLLKYADFYTDSCYHPLILKDENIFKQECWRYRLEKAEDPLSIEGTVYSEMLAASDITTSSKLSNWHTAFPGSTISNESGGDPDHIPEMTYEELKAYHDKYYHPSNCLATLYGKIDDFESFAKLLNEEFSQYDKKKFTFDDKDFVPLKTSAVNYNAFPASENEDVSNQTIVDRDYILRGISSADLKKATLLAYVLNDENSPVVSSVHKKYPQANVSISVVTEGPENMLDVNVTNVGSKEDAEDIASIIDKSLKKIAKEGISENILEKIEHNLKAINLLSGEGTTKGVNIAANTAYFYYNTGDVWFMADINGALNKITKFSKNGDFQRILTKYVSKNKLKVLNVTYPEQGLLEKQTAERQKALDDKKASMTKEEIDALVEDTKAFDSRIDADDATKAEIVASIKGVSLADLPEEVPDIKITSSANDKNVRTITAKSDVKGIGAAQITLDISDLTIEEAMWAKLYTSMMFEADTTEHKASELKDLRDMSMLSFGVDIDASEGTDEKPFIPYISMSWNVFDEDIDGSFDVLSEVLTKTKTNQGSKIKGVAEYERYLIKNEIISSSDKMILLGGIGSDCDNYLYRVSYLEYYDFLGDVISKLDSDPSYVIKNLNNVKKKIANSYGAILGYAGSTKGTAAFKKSSAAFADSLGNSPKTRAEFERAELSDAYIVNSGANFNYKYMTYADLGIENITPEEEAEFEVMASMISDAFTIPYLRNYYGAYGAYVKANEDGVMFYSYRDPNIAETYAVYDMFPEFADAFVLDQETLDGYIMAEYSGLVQPKGDLSDAYIALLYAFEDRDYCAEKAAALKTLKKMTPERVNELKAYFIKAAKDGNICTVGTPDSVEANSKLFKDTKTPFSE